MKVVYMLFMLITQPDGSEQLLAVSGEKHKDLLSCKVEQVHFKNSEYLSWHCMDVSKFKNGEEDVIS